MRRSKKEMIVGVRKNRRGGGVRKQNVVKIGCKKIRLKGSKREV